MADINVLLGVDPEQQPQFWTLKQCEPVNGFMLVKMLPPMERVGTLHLPESSRSNFDIGLVLRSSVDAFAGGDIVYFRTHCSPDYPLMREILQGKAQNTEYRLIEAREVVCKVTPDENGLDRRSFYKDGEKSVE